MLGLIEIDDGGGFSDEPGACDCEPPGPTGMFGAVVCGPLPLLESPKMKIAATIAPATTRAPTMIQIHLAPPPFLGCCWKPPCCGGP